MVMVRMSALLALASFLSIQSTTVAAQALSGHFDVLSYNVAGLPEPLSSSNPKTNTPLISPRLSNYTIVNVQEDFNYHSALYSLDLHTHRTATSGPVPLGSGLNTLAYTPLFDLARKTWDTCWIGTGDCLTPKGFTALRTQVSPGVWVDIYNLHADAGDDELDFVARKGNFRQLAEFVAKYSAGNAVIMFGDYNSRYTQQKDSIRDLLAATGTTDVWLQLYRGNTPPPFGNSIECPFPVPAGQERQDCEQIDKVLYRPSPLFDLRATGFSNENSRFLTSDGKPLSDHFPMKAEFEWGLKQGVRVGAEGMVGGTGGGWFNDVTANGGLGSAKTVSLRGGSRLDRVEVELRDGRKVAHGGMGGGATAALDVTEGVREMRACEGDKDGGKRVFFLRIVNEKGEKVEAGKEGSGVQCWDWRKPDSGRWGLGGFLGRSGTEVDLLAPIWVRV